MSLLGGILGHASEINKEELQNELSPVIIDGETVELAFKVVRDLFIFTNKRIIFIDKQGVTGHKKEYTSIPYRSINYFSIESAGHFDMDSELRIWIKGAAAPIKKELKRETNIEAIQKTLALHVLK